MALHFKSTSLPPGLDTVELDRAIHNLEFEKEQQNKEIEREKQQISALEAALKEKQDEIRQMETEIARMDEETKNYHRQFRQIKDNKDSLKKHTSVLNIHLENVEAKLNRLAEKFASESKQHDETLQHYHDIWKSYEEVYMQQGNAQELMKWQLEVLQRKEAIKEGNVQIARLQAEVDDVEAEIKENEPPFQNIQEFIIKIAEIKVSTMNKYGEAGRLVHAVSSAENEISMLQQNQAAIMKKIEEKRRQEEQERQRKENEKALREKAQQEELLKKKKAEQEAAASKPGVYKFGQFIHRAPNGNQPPPSRVPNTKRSAPSQPTPRTPLLIPSPASNVKGSMRQAQSVTPSSKYLAPFNKYTVPSVHGHKSAMAPSEQSGIPVQKAHTPKQQGNRFFLNMPQSPAPAARQNKPVADDQRSGPIPDMPMTPSTALRASLRQMSLQTPGIAPHQVLQAAGRTAPPSGPRPLVEGPPPAPIIPARTVMSPNDQRSGMLPMGPGGDAQPCPVISVEQKQQQQQQQQQTDFMQFECSSQSSSVYEMENNADIGMIQEFPMTQRTSVASGSAPHTPKTPDPNTLDLQDFRDRLGKSPGFSYSVRSMFGDQNEPLVQEQTSPSENSSVFQENPFFNSLFGMGATRSDQPPSPSPANMFGSGDPEANRNAQPSAPLQGGEGGGAMALFGPGSPSIAPQSQPQQQDSMGFSFNFGDSAAPSQDSVNGGSGGGSKGGFCLF